MLHCWMGKREYVMEIDPNDESNLTPEWIDGTCMLENGHTGDHEFTPDDQIIITFAPNDKGGQP